MLVKNALALGLIKEIDTNFSRTLGIITKVDLMNEDTHVADYLFPDKISQVSLSLSPSFNLYRIR